MLRLIHKTHDYRPGQSISLKEYESRFRRLGSMSTAEEFWSLYNFLESDISTMHDLQYDLSLFRDGIEPKWEDIENTNGGALYIFKPRNIMECFRHVVCCCFSPPFFFSLFLSLLHNCDCC